MGVFLLKKMWVFVGSINGTSFFSGDLTEPMLELELLE